MVDLCNKINFFYYVMMIGLIIPKETMLFLQDRTISYALTIVLNSAQWQPWLRKTFTHYFKTSCLIQHDNECHCVLNNCWFIYYGLFMINATVNGHLELTLLKGRQRFDAVSTSNLEVYKFRDWWIFTYFIYGHDESLPNNI